MKTNKQIEQDFKKLLISRADALAKYFVLFWFSVSLILAFYQYFIREDLFYTQTLLLVAAFFSLIFIIHKMNFSVVSRLMFSLGYPLLIIFISVINKIDALENGILVYTSNFFDGRFLLFVSLVFPILISNMKEKVVFYFSLIFPLILLILFDSIHDWFGVGAENFGTGGSLYRFSSVLYSILGYVFISSSFIFMKRRSEKSEFESFKMNEQNKAKMNVLLEFSEKVFLMEGNLDKAYTLACHTLAATLSLDRVTIWNFDDRNTLMINKALFENGEMTEGHEVLNSKDYTQYFQELKGDNLLVITNTLTDKRFNRFKNNYLLKKGIKSKFDIVFLQEGNRLGCISCESTQSIRKWEVDEIIFARSIGDIISSVFVFNKLLSNQKKLVVANEAIRTMNTGLEEIIIDRTQELELRKKAIVSYAQFYAGKINRQVEEVADLVSALGKAGEVDHDEIKASLKENILLLDELTRHINKSIVENDEIDALK